MLAIAVAFAAGCYLWKRRTRPNPITPLPYSAAIEMSTETLWKRGSIEKAGPIELPTEYITHGLQEMEGEGIHELSVGEGKARFG